MKENKELVATTEWVGWKDDLHELGLDRPEVLQQLEANLARIHKYVRAKTEGAHNKLSRAVKEAKGKIEDLQELLHASEADFLSRMKTTSADIAKLQATIEVEKEAAIQFSAIPGSALGEDLESLASATSAAIQYYVGVYTALIFYRLPETWKANSTTGKKHKEALAAALTSLNARDRVVVFETMCDHKLVARMRLEMNIPRREFDIGDLEKPSGARASGQVSTVPPAAEESTAQAASGQVSTVPPAAEESTAQAASGQVSTDPPAAEELPPDDAFWNDFVGPDLEGVVAAKQRPLAR